MEIELKMGHLNCWPGARTADPVDICLNNDAPSWRVVVNKPERKAIRERKQCDERPL